MSSLVFSSCVSTSRSREPNPKPYCHPFEQAPVVPKGGLLGTGSSDQVLGLHPGAEQQLQRAAGQELCNRTWACGPHASGHGGQLALPGHRGQVRCQAMCGGHFDVRLAGQWCGGLLGLPGVPGAGLGVYGHRMWQQAHVRYAVCSR